MISGIDSIDKRIKARARRAFQTFPFNAAFYAEVQLHGLNAEQVFLERNKFCLERERWLQSSGSVEEAFQALTRVGILRREVDGQGLTSRVRLTPFARLMLEEQPDLPLGNLSLPRRFFYLIFRRVI